MATSPRTTSTTTAFEVQAAISFAVSLLAIGIAIAFIPANPWIRGVLALGVLYAVTSSFTLSKTVRDRHESSTVLSRVDQARLEKLLAEYDPYKVETPS